MNKKNTIITIPLDEMKPGGATGRCTNLLAVNAEGDRVLTVVPQPVAVAAAGYRPLACFHDTGGGTHLLLTRGEGIDDDPAWLGIMHDGMIDDVAASQRPLTAIPRAGGFIVMTAGGPVELLRDDEDGSWSLHSRTAPGGVADITLSAVDCGTLSASTSAVTIKDIDFSRSSPTVGSAGRRAIGRELAGAYSRLAALAADGRVWMQPVLVRYHLISSSGERIFSSEPALVAPDTWQCVTPLSAECAKNGETLDIPALHLHARAFRIALDIGQAGVASLAEHDIRAIEVCVTPQMHPLDDSAEALETTPVRVQRASTATPDITVALPGATDAFNPRNRRRADALRALMARIDKAERRETVIEEPLMTPSVTIERKAPADTGEESALIRSVLSTAAAYNPADYSQTLLREISAPNTFTAAAATSSGDTVAWADITPLPAGAAALTGLFSGMTDGAFSGLLIATMRDGSSRHTAFSGTRRPTAWAPVVCYPDPHAVSLEAFITDTATSQTRHGRITLSALADGSRASAVDTALSATPFESWSGPIPAADDNENAGRRRPGAVVACRLGEPLTPVAAAECCHSPVMALTPAVRSQSSWDFSRCHLYAFSAAASYAVSVNIARGSISASVIDPRGIDSSEAVARTPEATAALVAGRLIKVAAARADDTDTPPIFSRVAWDPDRQRLALLDGKGNLYLRDGHTGGMATVTAPVDFESMTTVAGRLWLCDSETLMRLPADGETGECRQIAWRTAVKVPLGARAVALEVIMSASDFDGRITLTGQGAPSGSAVKEHTILSLRVRGALRAPVVRRIVAPPRPVMHLSIEGSASADTVIKHIAIHFSHTQITPPLLTKHDRI